MKLILGLALLSGVCLAAPTARDDGSATEADLAGAFKQTLLLAQSLVADALPSIEDVDTALQALQAQFQKATDDGDSTDDYVSSDNLDTIIKQIEDMASVQGAACVRFALNTQTYSSGDLGSQFDQTYFAFEQVSNAVFPKAQTDVYPGPRTSPIQDAFSDYAIAMQICRDAYPDLAYANAQPSEDKKTDKKDLAAFTAGGMEKRVKRQQTCSYDPVSDMPCDGPPACNPQSPYWVWSPEGGADGYCTDPSTPPCTPKSPYWVPTDDAGGGYCDEPVLERDSGARHVRRQCVGYSDEAGDGCGGDLPPCDPNSPYWIPSPDGSGDGYCIDPVYRRDTVVRRDTADDLNAAKDALDDLTNTAESSSDVATIVPKIDAATSAFQTAYNNTISDSTQYGADDVSNLATLVANRLVGSVSATCRALKSLTSEISSSYSAESEVNDALNNLAVSIIKIDAATVSRSLADGVDLDSLLAGWQSVNVNFHECTDAFLTPVCSGPPTTGPIYDNRRRQGGYACPL